MKDVARSGDIQSQVEADYMAADNVFDFHTPPRVERRVELELMTYGNVVVALSPEFDQTSHDLRKALDILLDGVESMRNMIRQTENEEMEREMNRR